MYELLVAVGSTPEVSVKISPNESLHDSCFHDHDLDVTHLVDLGVVPYNLGLALACAERWATCGFVCPVCMLVATLLASKDA